MAETEITMRLAQRADAAALLAFLQGVAPESDAILLPGLDHVTVAEEAVRLSAVADRDDCLILLACLGPEIVGVLTIMNLAATPGVGEMGLVIAKRYWHQGIGRLLMEEGQYWFENYSTLDQLMLTVFDHNIWGKKLYQDIGFQTVGTLIEPSADGQVKPATKMVYP